LLYGFGVPVVIGPMNGGMEWPPAFRPASGRSGRAVLRAARATASLLNRIMPGKRQAALLLVANQRTREALPDGVEAPVVEMVENGVDLRVWDAESPAPPAQPAVHTRATTFAFMGRLVDWKAVDLLIRAFAKGSARQPLRLLIIGDGVERPALVDLARELGLAMSTAQDAGTPATAAIEFAVAARDTVGGRLPLGPPPPPPPPPVAFTDATPDVPVMPPSSVATAVKL
jgi:glycosyltransferase involved in cell wall biosynthesis